VVAEADVALLEIEQLRSGYGQVEVLHGVELQVDDGECVALLGRNGAGKTTLLRAISGIQGATTGRIAFQGLSLVRRSPPAIARMGIAHVQEGRRIFRKLNVVDNLKLGAYSVGRSGVQISDGLESIYELFPVLRRKARELAGLLSGGEQQMLAVGQALMAGPSLLLLDEPSAGLAPPLVADLFRTLRRLSQTGVGILLAEQYVAKALEISQRAYVLERGLIVLEGPAESVAQDGQLERIYMGLSGMP
jgi:branched-chain amino acid transport system ATP-binding protein